MRASLEARVPKINAPSGRGVQAHGNRERNPLKENSTGSCQQAQGTVASRGGIGLGVCAEGNVFTGGEKKINKSLVKATTSFKTPFGVQLNSRHALESLTIRGNLALVLPHQRMGV